MKVVILAGGFGTRISEESHLKPKPMVEIGEKPILWHIMKYYSSFGYNDFIICAGYKQQVVKQWFANYYINNSDITFDFTKDRKDRIAVHKSFSEPWKVSVIDTGLHTMTGGRIKRIGKYLDGEPFFLTYGDGVADVDLAAEVEFHKSHGKLATMMATHPETRFGVLDMNGAQICDFREKSQADVGWINGGYMILDPKVLDYIADDDTVFEQEPLRKLATDGELMAFKHRGFWQCMDTLRDKERLEKMIKQGKAPWIRWEHE